MKENNLTGLRFGKLVALRCVGSNKYNKKIWECVCDCNPNKTVNVIGSQLLSGKTKSCGCLKKERNFNDCFIDISGQKFGKITAIKLFEKNGEYVRRSGHLIWTCVCDCDPTKEIYVDANSLKTGNTKSCGCLKKDTTTKHGKSMSKIYSIWTGILQRCLNKNNCNYEYYGGRGITICDEWLEFEKFYEDMGDCPEGYSIERINNNKGYFKDNCKWATRNEQQRNKRSSKLDINKVERIREFLWSGISYPELAKLYNVSKSTIQAINENRTWKKLN